MNIEYRMMNFERVESGRWRVKGFLDVALFTHSSILALFLSQSAPRRRVELKMEN